jgi:hypothetical protein
MCRSEVLQIVTEVSEEPSASVFKVEDGATDSSETLVTVRQTSQHDTLLMEEASPCELAPLITINT